ncbi:GNAT family N-acetyltransferase [Bacillus salitolerans]|uniref:GNAT family N-acetyltransferase n=1 Tax=Bacillus salitolerans TaxID=1437434 RepID=A0ABW4LTS7_9BACI
MLDLYYSRNETTNMISIIDFTNDRLVQELYQLQRASYLIEAKIINFDDIPPLLETLEDFRNCKEMFLGYFEEGVLAGAISFEKENRALTICRLVVHPNHFRKGIAQSLLHALEALEPKGSIQVSTGRDNEPAIKLYSKNGYTLERDIEVVPGLVISSFIKRKEMISF